MSTPFENEHPPDQPKASGALVKQSAGGAGLVQAIAPRDDGLFGPALGSPASNVGSASPSLSVSALLRAKWWMLGVFVLLSAATVPWVWMLVQPKYQAVAIVRVSPVVSSHNLQDRR